MPSSRFLTSFSAEARVPEHLLPYVRAVSGLEPQEHDGFLAWSNGETLILVGHPCGSAGFDTERLDATIRKLESLPATENLTVLAPIRPSAAPSWAVSGPSDFYWGIPLPHSPGEMAHGQKLRNMLRRAGKEITIVQESWQPEHKELTDMFSRTHALSPATRFLFGRIETYITAVPDAVLFSARDSSGTLQGFSIGDYTALETAFYLFAFRHPQSPPGTADALLAALAEEGIRRGHALLNLGLGINSGIAFFKRKWNAEILSSHVETTWTKHPPQKTKTPLGTLKKWLGLSSS